MKQALTLNATLPPPQAIIFDWDNTLVESHETITYALNRLFEVYKMPSITVHESKRSPQKALNEVFPMLFGDQWQKARNLYHQYYEEVYLEFLKPKEGALLLLEHLTNEKIPLFILSNKTHEHLEMEAKALKWQYHFHVLRGSREGSVDKPNPVSVQQVLENSGLHPKKETIWFVGDSPIDAQCALQSGCIPIIIPEVDQIDHFQSLGEEVVFCENLLTVKDFLDFCQ